MIIIRQKILAMMAFETHSFCILKKIHEPFSCSPNACLFDFNAFSTETIEQSSFFPRARARARVHTRLKTDVEKVCFSNNSLPSQNPVQQKHQKKEGDDMLLAETASPSLYVNSFVALRPKEIDV